MATVSLTFLSRHAAGNDKEAQVMGDTVTEVIDALETRYPGVREVLCKEDKLDPGITVVVDGVVPPTGLAAPVKPDSEIHFLPVIGGG
jgi:molybdopterin converting factor small subunit